MKPLHRRLWDCVRNRAEACVWDRVWDRIWDRVWVRVWNRRAWDRLWNRINAYRRQLQRRSQS